MILLEYTILDTFFLEVQSRIFFFTTEYFSEKREYMTNTSFSCTPFFHGMLVRVPTLKKGLIHEMP